MGVGKGRLEGGRKAGQRYDGQGRGRKGGGMGCLWARLGRWAARRACVRAGVGAACGRRRGCRGGCARGVARPGQAGGRAAVGGGAPEGPADAAVAVGARGSHAGRAHTHTHTVLSLALHPTRRCGCYGASLCSRYVVT